MDLGKNAHIRLEPEDEYMHPIEAASNFNESMYINLFDHDQACGGWFRVGNRPNEGHAEMSFCFIFLTVAWPSCSGVCLSTAMRRWRPGACASRWSSRSRP